MLKIQQLFVKKGSSFGSYISAGPRSTEKKVFDFEKKKLFYCVWIYFFRSVWVPARCRTALAISRVYFDQKSDSIKNQIRSFFESLSASQKKEKSGP